MGRKKAVLKQGGDIFNTIGGPIIPEKLYDLNYTGKIKGLKNIYDKTTQKTEDQLNKISKDLKNMQDVKNNEEEKLIHLTAVRNKKKIADDKLFQKTKEDWYKMIFHDIGGTILTNVKGFATTAGSFAKNTFSLAANGGEGILFKVIIISIVIIIIVFLILGFTNSLPSADISNSNDITKSILTTDNENNFMNIKSGSLLTRFSNSLYNLVPNEYKYKFNSLNNSLSYITTGKNQYDDFLQPRNEITSGRNDDIFHISYNNNTECILKPKNIEINFNSDYYNNIDYNNINESLRDDIKYPDKITLPFKVNEKGKYELDYSNQKYSNLNSDVTNKLDKNKFLFISKKNNIQLNSFANNNINYNAGIIAMYAPILINKSYKGPTMTIKITDKYRNIYYNNQYKKLYYKDELNNNNIVEFSSIKTYDVICLYDQTENYHDYVFEDKYEDKKKPKLIYRNNIYSINFSTKTILYLSKKYPKIKSSIKTTIKFDILYNNNYMSILTDNSKKIGIDIYLNNDISNYKYIYTKTDIEETSKDYTFNTTHDLIDNLEVKTYKKLMLSSNDLSNMFSGKLYYIQISGAFSSKSNNSYTFGFWHWYYKSPYKSTTHTLIILAKENNSYSGMDIFICISQDDNELYQRKGINPNYTYEKRDFKNYYIYRLYSYESEDVYFEYIPASDRYAPVLYKDESGAYMIKFYRKSILYLNDDFTTSNTYNAVSVKINIEPNNFSYDLDDIYDYMDLLSSKKSSFIILDLKNDNLYKDLSYTIENKKEDKKENIINQNTNIYNGDLITTINIDIKDPSLIECLGSVHDIRSEYHMKMDPLNKGNVKERDEYTKKHSFIGNLYDLIIYKDI